MKLEIFKKKPPPVVASATNSTPNLRNTNTKLF